MQSPIEILDERLIDLRNKMADELENKSSLDAQLHDCKLRIVELNLTIEEMENIILKLKGMTND